MARPELSYRLMPPRSKAALSLGLGAFMAVVFGFLALFAWGHGVEITTLVLLGIGGIATLLLWDGVTSLISPVPLIEATPEGMRFARSDFVGWDAVEAIHWQAESTLSRKSRFLTVQTRIPERGAKTALAQRLRDLLGRRMIKPGRALFDPDGMIRDLSPIAAEAGFWFERAQSKSG